MSILQKRIILFTFVVLLFVSSFGAIFFTSWSERNIIQNIKVELLKANNLAAHALEVQNVSTKTTEVEYNNFSKAIANDLGCRVTIILPDGKVVADTETDYTHMENHLSRIEIKNALQGKEFASVRKSNTINHEHFIYSAAPIIKDGKIIAVIRLSKSIEDTNEKLTQIKMIALVLAIIIFILIFVLSKHFTRSIIRPLREMEKVANDFSKGNFDGTVNVAVDNDFKTFTDSFNNMAKDLKKTVNELKNDRDRLTAIINNINDGLILVDKDEIVTMINPVAAKLFNSNIENKKTLIEFTLSHELVEIFKHANEHSMITTFNLELANKKTTYLDIYVAPFDNGDVLIVLHDTTKERLTDKIRRDFVANVSHELKTPMAVIKAMAETIYLRGANDEKMTKDYSEKITGEIDRLTAITDDLLNLANIEEGIKKINKEDVNIYNFIHGILNDFTQIANKKNIELIDDIPKDLTATIDKSILSQISINLIDNAIKYNNKNNGGYITISAEKKEDRLILEFSDNGVGIEANDLERIFERFYRVDKARSKSQNSTGLGLAIVKHLVALHEGTITVSSIPNLGTTFTVTL